MRRPSLKAAEFQRALGTRPVARSAHFVLHYLPQGDAPAALPAQALDQLPDPELSTAQSEAVSVHVDELPDWRLGLVLPKRLARRSVTRSLLRHQARESVRRHAPAVAVAGWGPHAPMDAWVLRLRAPFDKQIFPSAASEALNREVRSELDSLWAGLCSRRRPARALAASASAEGSR